MLRVNGYKRVHSPKMVLEVSKLPKCGCSLRAIIAIGWMAVVSPFPNRNLDIFRAPFLEAHQFSPTCVDKVQQVPRTSRPHDSTEGPCFANVPWGPILSQLRPERSGKLSSLSRSWVDFFGSIDYRAEKLPGRDPILQRSISNCLPFVPVTGGSRLSAVQEASTGTVAATQQFERGHWHVRISSKVETPPKYWRFSRGISSVSFSSIPNFAEQMPSTKRTFGSRVSGSTIELLIALWQENLWQENLAFVDYIPTI